MAGTAYRIGQSQEVVTRTVGGDGTGEVVRVVGGYGGWGYGHGGGFFLFPLITSCGCSCWSGRPGAAIGGTAGTAPGAPARKGASRSSTAGPTSGRE